jgi:hypothetical protein
VPPRRYNAAPWTDRAVALLRERLAELEPLQEPDATFEAWRCKTEQTLRWTMGNDHELVQAFESIVWQISLLDDIVGKNAGIGVLEGAIYEKEELAELPDFASSASIDPALWEHVRRLVESEQWAQVASQTAIFVESKMRQWAGLPDSRFGKDLMVAVLKPGAGAFPLGSTPGEQEDWQALGIGFASGVGNATRHRIQRRDDDKRYAMGVLGAGSLLLTQLRHEHGNRLRNEPAPVATGVSAWSDDLRSAQKAGVAVEVDLLDGRHFFTGVADVDVENGFVSLHRPQTLGDTTTRVRVRLDDITSVAVTDVRWGDAG